MSGCTGSLATARGEEYRALARGIGSERAIRLAISSAIVRRAAVASAQGPRRKNDRPAAIFLRRRNVQSALHNALLTSGKGERERERKRSPDARLFLSTLLARSSHELRTAPLDLDAARVSVFHDTVPFISVRGGTRVPYT